MCQNHGSNICNDELKKINFINLHQHSHYSALDGIGTIHEYLTEVKKKNLQGFALTDHGVMSGDLELYRLARASNTSFVMGAELYITPPNLTDFSDLSKSQEYKYSHITLLVKNEVGYKNLCYLTTIASKEDHSYYRPRISLAELFQHKEGLIATTGCFLGLVPQSIFRKTGQEDELMKLFKKEFGEDFYIEIHPADLRMKWDRTTKSHIDQGHNPQEEVNLKLLELGKKYGVKAYLTQDAHLPNKEDKILQDIMIANSPSGADGWNFPESYELKTVEEMYHDTKKKAPYIKDSEFISLCEITMEVLEKCKGVELKFHPSLPIIKYSEHHLSSKVEALVQEMKSKTTDKALLSVIEKSKTDKALALTLAVIVDNKKIESYSPIYQARIAHELEVIQLNGSIPLCDYFLLLEDVARFVESKGDTNSTGRGSGVGSLVAYALNITEIDPVATNLLFERFLTKERVLSGSLPDIDFDTSNRDEIKEYLASKYGQEFTSLIGVMNTLKTKGALKDVLRIMRPEMDFMEVNNLTKKYDFLNRADFKTEIEFFQEGIKEDKVLASWFQKNPEIKSIVERLLGNLKSSGIHAGGIVVAGRPIYEVAPLTWSKAEQAYVTQYPMNDVEYSGLIKFDFLGLNTLKDIDYAFKLIQKRHDKKLTVRGIPKSDKKVFEAFLRGQTESIFQFNTPIATGLLLQLKKLDSIKDLATLTSIGRPGCLNMGMDKIFIKRKNGEDKVSYAHPILEEILKDTCGVITFQEQIMLIVQKLGDFSGDDSVNIMKSMSKKIREKVEKYKSKFLKGAKEKGLSEQVAEDIWLQMDSFAEYGFNLSHAYSYATLSYICMYLKIYYPLEWKCAVLTNADKDDFKEFYRSWNSDIERPNVNDSLDIFTINARNKIVMPLGSVNGVGDKASLEIYNCRPFESFEDFFSRVDKKAINKGKVLSLIQSGCFDFMEPGDAYEYRKYLIQSFFDLRAENSKPPKREREAIEVYMKEINERTPKQWLKEELKLLNFTAFDFFTEYQEMMNHKAKVNFGSVAMRPEQALELRNYAEVVLGGGIQEINIVAVKTGANKGKNMMRITVGSDKGSIEVVVFPNALEEDSNNGGKLLKLEPYTPIVISGKINYFNGKVSVILDEYLT